MQITIDPTFSNKLPTANSFEVVITTVDGDGDDYQDVIFSGFLRGAGEAALEHLLLMLDRLSNARYDADFNNVEGFNDWFYADWKEEFSDTKSLEVAGHKRDKVLWPYNAGDAPYSFESSRVTYYDENHLPHKVGIAL